MPSKLTPAVTLLSLIAAIHGSAQAALFAVDQGPYSPQNGNFAQWYQDTHGRTMDLCLSKALSSRVPSVPGTPSYMCVLNPNPGIFDDTQPVVFPSNFPDEAFWFTADAAITDVPTGIDLGYVAAVEAAFSAEDPVEGDQISFARIRIRVDVPVAGTYTVTHPYGVDVFNIDTPGRRAINMTRDIGIGEPKTYTGALGGDIGPFLRSVNGPYTETNPVTGGQERFIGDPNLDEAVTGSPFNTNFVRVEGPNGIDVRTTVFAVSGKLSTVNRPTPMIVQRATYSRRTGGPDNAGVQAQQDVFALAPPQPGTAKFIDTANSDVAMTEANGTGSWYGQSAANPTLPANLNLTADNSLAIAQSTPTTLPRALVDVVTIENATYSMSSGQISLAASTSDAASPGTLTAIGSSGGTIGTLNGDGPAKTLTTGISPIPPAIVQVISANGGSDTEEVVIVP
jgi:hypothetical protein